MHLIFCVLQAIRSSLGEQLKTPKPEPYKMLCMTTSEHISRISIVIVIAFMWELFAAVIKFYKEKQKRGGNRSS